MIWYLVAGAALLWLARYALNCHRFPHAKCLICRGSGKVTSMGGRVWRPSRCCDGSGRRRRAGTMLLAVAFRPSAELQMLRARLKAGH